MVRDSSLEKEFPNLSSNQKALYAIEDLPESVINQGSEAILDWFRNNIDDKTIVKDLNAAVARTEQSDTQFTTLGVISCTAAVGAAIAGLVFYPAKFLKVTKGLEALDGAKTFVTKTYQYYNYHKKEYRSKELLGIKQSPKQQRKPVLK
ncbi:hypothetical protein [Bacillus atrophaeus]|uniref:hypothetical protein n=1 Tax=Bacillus atrophaeus TaxID=1452 RepID=UPI00404213DF